MEMVARSRLEAVEMELAESEAQLAKVRKDARNYIDEIERDTLTLALRLMGEDDDTFSPETREVMRKWRPKCEAIIDAAHG